MLLVCIGVRGLGWPILVSICLIYTASFAAFENTSNSASAADNMTAFIIVTMVRIAPLLGMGVVVDKKKCPPTQLLAFSHLYIQHCCGLVISCH